jgi:hypothetical protein
LLLRCCLIVAALIMLTPRAAGAEESTIAVVIVARDASTRAPIAHAHVELESDTRSYDGFTDKTGTIRFTVVPDSYVVQLKQSDYAFGKATLLKMATDGAQFAFDGKRTTQKQIGKVTARKEAASVPDKRTGDQPGALIAGSVLANPYTVPNLGIGPGGALQIGAQGPSTTTATIDGAPVFPSGVPIPPALLGSDLFSSASSGGSFPGAPGGALALASFDPTLDWQGIATQRVSSYGGDEFLARARGTSGIVGISFSHGEQNVASPLNDAFFTDASGIASNHNTTVATSGDLLTLRLPVSQDNILKFTGGDTRATAPDTCTLLEGMTPCGLGPNNVQQDTFVFGALSDEITLDRATLTARAFASTITQTTDDANALFLGEPIGFDDTFQTHRVGLQLSSKVLVGTNRYATVNVQATRDISTISDQLALPGSLLPLPATSLFSSSVDLPIVAARRTSVNANIGYEDEDGFGKVSLGANGSYAINDQQHLNLSAKSGQLGAPLFGSVGAATPISELQFDCNGHALGSGASASGGPPTADQAQLQYAYNRGPLSASVTALTNIDHGYQVLGAIVPGISLGAALFPANYFSQAATAAGTLCGEPQPFTLGSLFLTTNGTAQTMVENRITANASLPLGPRLTLQGYYAIDQARAFAIAPAIANAINVRDGSQIPTLPLHTANASLSYAFSHASSAIAQVTDFGGTNLYSRHPFATVDLAAKVGLTRGDLLASVQNVGNTAAPEFTRFAPFPFLPQLYPARTYALTYRLPMGNAYVDRNQLLNPPVSTADGNTVILEPIKFEGNDHPDFLALNTTDTNCGPESRTRAQQMLADIGAYAAQIDAAREAGTEPQAATMDGIVFTPLRGAAGYSMRMAFQNKSLRGISPILHCGRIHWDDVATAQKLGIFIPDARSRYEDDFLTLYYAPQAGIYLAPQTVDETAASASPVVAKRPSFPTGIPIDRVTIDDAACPATYRGLVADVLADMRASIPAYYGGPASSARTADFTIGAHPAKGGRWLEIAFRDYNLSDAVGKCLDIPYAKDTELKSAELGGSNAFSSINYSPAVGLYRVSVH